MTELNSLEDEGIRIPHAFKGSSFSIPTPCGYCEVCHLISVSSVFAET